VRRLLGYDLLCYGAMACVTAGVALNVAFLQGLDGGGPGRLVLIPIAFGLATPFVVLTLRWALRTRRSRFLEAVGAGALLYLAGSAMLSYALPSFLRLRSEL
jgi:hypothetical protein